MRVRHPHHVIFLVLILLVAASSAFGTSVNMKFEGAAPSGIYPYYFSINGSSPATALMCDAYDNHIFKGESWKANVTSILSGQGLFGSKLLDYKAAGLIYKSLLEGHLTALKAQWAIWGLFSAHARANHLFASTGAAGVDSTFLALAATAPNSAFRGLFLYTPVKGHGHEHDDSGEHEHEDDFGTPQEFIGYHPSATVPEPGSLTLLGAGLLSMAGLIRKKFGV